MAIRVRGRRALERLLGAFTAICVFGACWSSPSRVGRPCGTVEVVNRSFYDHVVHVEGRRLGFAVGLDTTVMRLCRVRSEDGSLELTVHQMGGRPYVVRHPGSWVMGEPVRLVIGSLPNFTRLEPVR